MKKKSEPTQSLKVTGQLTAEIIISMKASNKIIKVEFPNNYLFVNIFSKICHWSE